jgi:signal transduction histidine kinase
MLGYTEEELKNLGVMDIHPKESLEYVISKFEAQAAGKKSLAGDIPCLRKDGTVVYADFNTVLAIIDGVECNFGIVRDITERKQVEEDLKQASEKLSKEHKQRKILSKRLIELLEKDRRQIAMELHDHIGQTLTSLKMNLELIHGKLKPGHTELEAQITTAQERAIQSIKDVKSISQGLRPTMIDALGLIPSLRELFSKTQQQTDIEIHFFSQRIPKHFEGEKELAIYRIAQEALNNIIRHAQAKNVFVNLIKKDEKLSLSVEDDGVGFDPDKVMKPSERKKSLGLLIMRERAVQLDGEFSIESQPGKGTHLLVEIPL